MFGYISPDAPYLFKKDETLYKALYCGLCKGVGKGCGQCARASLSYDMAFVSAFAHNICNFDVDIKKRRCMLHWFRRRPIAVADNLTVTIGCVNVVLAYFKLRDDKADGDKRYLLTPFFYGGYKRARKLHPQVVEIIKKYTDMQAETERAGCAIIDAASEPTALMMRDVSDYALGGFSTQFTRILFYAIGKWVYLADALDDYDKDVKKGRYNVLYNAIGGDCKAEMLAKGREELTFVFDSLFADMRRALDNIHFYFNHDLTDNIILRGIPLKTRSLLSCGCGKRKKKESKK